MLFHASIPARDPERVATVLAEVWRGRVIPFTAAPGTFVVTAGEGPEIHMRSPAARTHAPARPAGCGGAWAASTRWSGPRPPRRALRGGRPAPHRPRRRLAQPHGAAGRRLPRGRAVARELVHARGAHPPPCRTSTAPPSSAVWRRAGSSRCAAEGPMRGLAAKSAQSPGSRSARYAPAVAGCRNSRC